MRRMFEALRNACFFLLCYAAVPLFAGQILLNECRAGLGILLLLIPVSFLLSLVPGKVGGRRKEEAPIIRQSRGSDPDPDRNLRNEELPMPERRSFPLRAVCCLIASIAVGAGMYLLPVEVVQSAAIFRRVCMAIVMAAMLPMALRVVVLREEDTGSMVAGLIMYMLCGVAAHFMKDALFEQWLTVFAFCFLLFGAFSMNDRSVRRGASVGEEVRPPAAMRRRNRLMLGVLAVIGGIAIYFDRIREVVSSAVWWIMRMIGKFIAWLFNLGASDEVSSGTTGGGGQMDMAAVFGTSEKSVFWEYMEKVMFVVVIIALIGVICLFGRRIWRILVDLTRRLIIRIKGFAAAVGEDYQDEQESLFDWGETTKELGEGLKERLARMMKREKRYEQMNVRERMRYIVKILYRRSEHPQGLKSLTVHEAMQVINTGDAQPEEIARIYDQARYAQQETNIEIVDRLRKEAKV